MEPISHVHREETNGTRLLTPRTMVSTCKWQSVGISTLSAPALANILFSCILASLILSVKRNNDTSVALSIKEDTGVKPTLTAHPWGGVSPYGSSLLSVFHPETEYIRPRGNNVRASYGVSISTALALG